MTDTVTMYPKLERREWIFTPPAEDPRDARIAALEAALEAIRWLTKDLQPSMVWEIANAALMPPPEGDMTITVEELDA